MTQVSLPRNPAPAEPSALEHAYHGRGYQHALKDERTFAVLGRRSDISRGEHGIYQDETRFVSELVLEINGFPPILLSTTSRRDNAELTTDLTNDDIEVDGTIAMERDWVHIARSCCVHEASYFEHLQISNYHQKPLEIEVAHRFAADFRDMFEIRGLRRAERGELHPPQVRGDTVVWSYTGLDGVVRRSVFEWSPQPVILEDSLAVHRLTLAPKHSRTIDLRVRLEIDGRASAVPRHTEAVERIASRRLRHAEQECAVETSNALFNRWFQRSASDLHMLMTDMPEGPFVFAGIPWFSTMFGRDGIVAALQTLWWKPELARGTLLCLAARQATELDEAHDAEPGKIVHEVRHGEMAALGEVPFSTYYGTVDATPLFIMLASAYVSATADLNLLDTIWPNILRALEWIDVWGDADNDGFVEYSRRTVAGLQNQGWKDSPNSVFHADGSIARGPIALCEVQGYIYAAKRGAATLARLRGETALADRLEADAEALRARFEVAFWCDDIGAYALALDGEKKPCRVRTSNAGQCLWSGIVAPERATRLATTLTEEDMFSGWGVRTVSTREAFYNPMSYHNGSIWPHDVALIGLGLSRYGMTDHASALLTAMLEASTRFDRNRLPELFCGFAKLADEAPTPYPSACAPQAWSAGTVFMLLAACLGMTIDGINGRVLFRHPHLPRELRELRFGNLRFNDVSMDLLIHQHKGHVGVSVERLDGPGEVAVLE